MLEADFRTAPGAIVGVVAVFIAVDVVGVFLAGVVVVVGNFLDGVVVVAVCNFFVFVDFSFPLSLLTASSSLDTMGSEKLARLKWSNSGGKRFVPLKNGLKIILKNINLTFSIIQNHSFKFVTLIWSTSMSQGAIQILCTLYGFI